MFNAQIPSRPAPLYFSTIRLLQTLHQHVKATAGVQRVRDHLAQCSKVRTLLLPAPSKGLHFGLEIPPTLPFFYEDGAFFFPSTNLQQKNSLLCLPVFFIAFPSFFLYIFYSFSFSFFCWGKWTKFVPCPHLPWEIVVLALTADRQLAHNSLYSRCFNGRNKMYGMYCVDT